MALTTEQGESFESYETGPEDASQAVLILHDWWGLLDYNKICADSLGGNGFRALAIDLYDGYYPEDARAAGHYQHSLTQDELDQKISAALKHLHADGKRKVAVLGWSFGGVQAQQAALKYPQWVNAQVLYYCRLIINNQNVQELSGATLAIFAESERTWPDKQVMLEACLGEHGKDCQCLSFDAEHGFANPDSEAYEPEAEEQAWLAVIEFLKKSL